MVFTNLNSSEKQAFFDLLDEYFSSRPELLNGTSSSRSSPPLNTRSAASAVHRALTSNTDSSPNITPSGLKQNSFVKNSPFASAASSASSDPPATSVVGRVAAASLAFQNVQNQTPQRSTPPPPVPRAPGPPLLPRRASSNVSSSQEEEEENVSPPARTPLPPRRPVEAEGLQSRKSFGKMDTSSFGAGVVSLVSKKKPAASAPPIPSAFPKVKNNFAPPPSRTNSGAVSSRPPMKIPSPEPEPEEEEEEEEEGEWVEALYDYNSGEAGDLVIHSEQRIKVISKDSDDWWTGEIDGKSGLFPASYVKSL